MTGLETIVEEIIAQANKSADEIRAQAERNADSKIAEANRSAEKTAAESAERLAAYKKAGRQRAESSAQLAKRQAILAVKQEIITDMVEKAYEKLRSYEGADYESVILKSVEKSVQSAKGEIIFAGGDRAKVTPELTRKIEGVARAHGGELSVSSEYADIDGGFILRYGGIEENCSFRAMLYSDREKLADMVNELLFTGR